MLYNAGSSVRIVCTKTIQIFDYHSIHHSAKMKYLSAALFCSIIATAFSQGNKIEFS